MLNTVVGSIPLKSSGQFLSLRVKSLYPWHPSEPPRTEVRLQYPEGVDVAPGSQAEEIVVTAAAVLLMLVLRGWRLAILARL